MAIDPRFLAESGREVFIGNELLVKGALETEGGVHLMTGYPGSPVAGFFDVLGDIGDLLKTKGVRAFQANNEALGVAAVAVGAARMRARCARRAGVSGREADPGQRRGGRDGERGGCARR